jgi:TPR repeat protein
MLIRALVLLSLALPSAQAAGKLKGLEALEWAAYTGNVFWTEAEWKAWARKEAAQGQPVAMTLLGGAGDAEKEMWKTRALAAAQPHIAAGDPVAHYVVGMWTYKPEQCVHLKASMDGGYLPAKYAYGVFCVDGDDAALFRLYREGAEKGDALAQAKLIACYRDGRCTYQVHPGTNVPVDRAESLRWAVKSSEQGNQFAMLDAASCYEFGKGAPQDLVEAYKWYWLSQGAGNFVARNALKQIAPKMTPEQIADAKKRAAAVRAAAKARRPKF